MSPQPTYRPGTLEDIAQIQHVLLQTWMDSYAGFIPFADMQRYFMQHYSDWHFVQWFHDTNVWSYVAAVEGQIIGYARAHFSHDEHRLYVESLYVLPAYQGQGSGLALLHLVEERALQQGHQAIWLGVMAPNVAALAWYQKLGFQFVEETPFHMGGSTVNHLIGYRPIQGRG